MGLWESFYKIISYVKKYVDLKKRENALIDREEKLKKGEEELNKLRTISNENSQNPSLMIDFNLSNPKVNALDTIPSLI